MAVGTGNRFAAVGAPVVDGGGDFPGADAFTCNGRYDLSGSRQICAYYLQDVCDKERALAEGGSGFLGISRAYRKARLNTARGNLSRCLHDPSQMNPGGGAWAAFRDRCGKDPQGCVRAVRGAYQRYEDVREAAEDPVGSLGRLTGDTGV